MTDKIRVAMYRVGQPMELVEMDNDLPPMQAAVGGYLEAVGLSQGLTLVCNEDGQRERLPINRAARLYGREWQIILGNFFVVRTAGHEMVSLLDTDAGLLAELVGRDLSQT